VAIKCPKCHSANLDTSSFCSDCGTRLGRAEKDGVGHMMSGTISP
jgi:uncharacterized OB-fold protein